MRYKSMRLTSITTKTGDDGTTGLANGSRVDKDCIRLDALGDLDELNSVLGILVASIGHSPLADQLMQLQNLLFDMGAELALPGHNLITEQHLHALEQQVTDLNAQLPPLKEFILPGGNLSAAHAHHARAVCRRAERNLLRLSRSEQVNSLSLKAMNRMSDLLFVMARTIARKDDQTETSWKR
jgi:cob(I)alamin adenosyltransferase